MLAVPNPFEAGEYSCHINPLSEGAACIPSGSNLNHGATVLLDGVQGRMMLMNSEMEVSILHEK